MGAHPVDVYVGKRLRSRRGVLGMSQDDLGKAVGITFQQIQKYERGINRVGSSRLYEFSKLLSVPVGYFFDEFSSESILAEAETNEFEKKGVSNTETLALVQAYYQILNPTVRNKMLSLIKALKSTAED